MSAIAAMGAGRDQPVARLAAVPPRPDTPPGVEPVLRRDRATGRPVWRFRARRSVNGIRRSSPTFDRVDEAVAWQALGRIERARGDVVVLSAAHVTLAQAAETLFWRGHAPVTLARNTLTSYKSVWRRHLVPFVGDVLLRQVTAARVEQLRDELLAAGRSVQTVHRALTVLQAVLARVVAHNALPANPVRDVPKPPRPKRQTRYIAGAAAIVRLLDELNDPVDRALVSVMAFAGLRPSEALALEDRHVRERTLLVEQRVIAGRVLAGLKTTSRQSEQGFRAPALVSVVREDLERAIERRGNPDQRTRLRLIFPGRNGQPLTPHDWRRWRERVFMPAVHAAGVPITRPYDLRHTCASMLLAANRPLKTIAEHMGHSPSTLERYYGHVIRELELADPVPVEEQIAAARGRR